MSRRRAFTVMTLRSGVLLLVLAAALTGCAVSGAFYPIRGPLAAQSPLPAYPARLTGVLSGSISVTLDHNDACSGRWQAQSGQRAAQSGSTPLGDMAAAWDTVYGSGYYNAHVLGAQVYAQSQLNCNMGTLVTVEFANENNTAHNTKGIGVDNRGNLFKIAVFN